MKPKATVFGTSRTWHKWSLTASIVQRLAISYDVTQVSANDTLDLYTPGQVLVITAFDHEHPTFQEQQFINAFYTLRNTDTHIVVLGSTAHRVEVTKYAAAKGELYERFYELGKNQSSYKCKLTLIEPGMCERMRGTVAATGPHLKFEQVTNALMFALDNNPKFLHIAMRGNEEHAIHRNT